MGDLSELRTLIVIFTLVAVTVSLVILIPSGFLTSDLDPSYSPDATVHDVIAWNSTYTLNITQGAEYSFVLNGFNIQVESNRVAGYGALDNIWSYTYAQFFIFVWDIDNFRYYYGDTDLSYEVSPWPPVLRISDLDNYNNQVVLEMVNSKTRISASFVYNDTAYVSFQDAYDNDGLSMVFSVEWDDRNTSMNALQLVGMVLTASLPDIGTGANVFLAFIGWAIAAAAAYLVFIFALRLVGAVFGGGGA